MFCSNCGKEASGNFCSHCGQPLANTANQSAGDTKKWSPIDSPHVTPPPNPQPENTAQVRFSKVDEAVQRRTQASVSSAYPRRETPEVRHYQEVPVQKSTRPPVKQASVEPVRTKAPRSKSADSLDWIHIPSLPSFAQTGIASILRYISMACMLALTLYTAFGLFRQRSALKKFSETLDKSNPAVQAFTLLSAAIVIFGLLSCLWILSRRKVHDGRKVKRHDSGRGLVPFLVFGLLTFFSADFMVWLIQTDREFLSGAATVLQVFLAHKSTNMLFCGVGLVCTVLRGVKFH